MPDVASRLSPELRNPLDQLRGAIRTYLLTDSALTLAVVFVLWLACGVALDYGLFKLVGFDWALDAPLAARLGLDLVILLTLLAIFVIGRSTVVEWLGRIRPRWLSRILVHEPWAVHILIGTVLAPVFLVLLLVRFLGWIRSLDDDRELALVLEKRFPEQLGDKLITAIELQDVEAAKRVGYSEEMVRDTIADAHKRVAELSVNAAMNWDQLNRKGTALAMLGGLLLVVAYFGHRGLNARSRAFTSELPSVVGQWAERNVLVKNTPWPRNTHIELVDFNGNELRVGKDAAAVKIKARAFKWVIADSRADYGWRPLLWSDLGERLPGTATLAANILARGGTLVSSQVSTWDIDRLETMLPNQDGVKELLAKLNSLAIDSRYDRVLRKLELPSTMAMNYGGEKTRGRVNLGREANNIFGGDLPTLKESIRFTVRGDDFITKPRSVTVVPPPQFAKLSRTEFQPAYLYHLPPILNNADGTPKTPDFADLKGLYQQLPEKELSLTGEKSIFSITQGTEFIINCETTKPLASVKVVPKIGRLPGQPMGSTTPLVIMPNAANRSQFTLAFRGADRLSTNTEFEFVLIDDDNVTTTRTIIVQVADDASPQVELGVDVLRKINNAFWVTPVARVPFLTESKIKDDTGLSKVVFAYGVAKVDAQVTVEAKLPLLASIFADTPLMPSLPNAIRGAIGARILQDASDQSAGKISTGEVIVSRFAEEINKRKADTLDRLKAKLASPSAIDDPQVVKELRFMNQDSDVFDLRAALPTLLEKDPLKSQSRYRIDLNLVATDTNIESGPKRGQNLEGIRLLVVSEAELLVEMAKDEETQITKLDEVLKKLREAQGKLSQTVIRLRELSPPPDVLASAAVRAVDVAQDIAKARELTASILTEYRRLEKEARFNDIVKQQQQCEKLCDKLTRIGEDAFPRAEETHKQFTTALQENRRPDVVVMDRDQNDLAALIAILAAFRAELGEALSYTGELAKLERLQKRIKENDRIFDGIYKQALERQRMPIIATIAPVELKVGEKKLVKNPLNWLFFDGNSYTVKFEGPSELQFPKQVAVADDKNDVEYEVTAGTKPGMYTLKLIPSVGNAIEVTIVVR